MLVCFLMGYASGLPLLLTLSTLQAWMKDENIDLGSIGLIALVGMPYSWKFLWAPLFDRFALPWLGRRRGWLLCAQILLAASIAGMGLFDLKEQLIIVAAAACLTAFFSASQDTLVDSYRREYLSDQELGLGSSLYIYGYRMAMLISGAGALFLADHLPWKYVYSIMGACMLPGVLATLWAPEPTVTETPPRNFQEAVIGPFVEFFKRDKALLILAFILFYKAGDSMASHMTLPFYLELGFSKSQIAAVGKIFGLWAILAGTFLGGLALLRWGIPRCLYLFGLVQAVSTAGFALLYAVGPSIPWLAGVIAFENISGGMGTAAYTAYMATQTNKKFTATQYALLTSMMGIPRIFLAAPTGYMATWMGWPTFFITCALIALPGMICLFLLLPWHELKKNVS